jgi:hypothetical protein
MIDTSGILFFTNELNINININEYNINCKLIKIHYNNLILSPFFSFFNTSNMSGIGI